MSNESVFFLSDDEIAEFTGLDQASAQARYLRGMGFNIKPNRDNKIRLAREAMVRHQIGIQMAEAANEPVLQPRKR